MTVVTFCFFIFLTFSDMAAYAQFGYSYPTASQVGDIQFFIVRMRIICTCLE